MQISIFLTGLMVLVIGCGPEFQADEVSGLAELELEESLKRGQASADPVGGKGSWDFKGDGDPDDPVPLERKEILENKTEKTWHVLVKVSNHDGLFMSINGTVFFPPGEDKIVTVGPGDSLTITEGGPGSSGDYVYEIL